MAMATLIDVFYKSLLVLLCIVLGEVTSEDQDVSQKLSLEFGSTTGTADFSGAVTSESPIKRDEWCPAVCPGCPACPPSPRQIPPGYKYYEGLGYYKMHYEQMNWHDAKGACEREGGYIAVLNSAKEANLASSFMTKYNIEHMHIGFFDVTKKGKYITVLGDPLSSTGYVVWRPGEPNNVGKENCGCFYANKGINDIGCNIGLPFLCELFA